MTETNEQVVVETTAPAIETPAAPIFRSSTMAESMKPIEVQEAPPVAETPAVETTGAVVNEQGTLQETAPVEENVHSFEIGFGEENAAAAPIVETPSVAPITDWREVIKSVDRKELAKELGFDDFDLEMAEHRRNGGDPTRYLEAKAMDYSKIPDERLALELLKEEYPFLKDSPDKLQKLFISKYKQDEFASDEEKELGSIQMQADAYKYRQKAIAEQQRFQIAAPIQPQQVNQPVIDNSQELQKIQQQKDYLLNHPATQNLNQSKRVTVDLGEAGKFNYNIDKPDMLTKAILDRDTWQKVISNAQGEPDIAKLQEITLFAINPAKFKNDLVSYGKSLGAKGLIEEGQNAKRPIGGVPRTNENETETEAWKTRARSGTMGR